MRLNEFRLVSDALEAEPRITYFTWGLEAEVGEGNDYTRFEVHARTSEPRSVEEALGRAGLIGGKDDVDKSADTPVLEWRNTSHYFNEHDSRFEVVTFVDLAAIKRQEQ